MTPPVWAPLPSFPTTARSYLLDGVKLWTTNGVIAELVVVMAMVPAHSDPDGTEHKGGITAFVVDMDSPGITVENRNAFMGLRGIENGVTRFHQVTVPAANRLGREGQGLKIALTTLNTGRLSIPGLCVAAGKWSLKIAREWSNASTQWGRPIGHHEAVGKKIAFIAATTFALEAVFEFRRKWRMPASEGHPDRSCLGQTLVHRAQLHASPTNSCRSVVAGALKPLTPCRPGAKEPSRRATAPGPRINRIFEGSSPKSCDSSSPAKRWTPTLRLRATSLPLMRACQDKARAAVGASGFYAKWLPKLVAGAGMDPRSYAEFGRLAKQLRFVERSSRRLARQTFYGMGRWQAKLEYKQAFLGRIVDIGAELFAMAACCSRAEMLLRTASRTRRGRLRVGRSVL